MLIVCFVCRAVPMCHVRCGGCVVNQRYSSETQRQDSVSLHCLMRSQRISVRYVTYLPLLLHVHTYHTTTVLQAFFRDHPGEPVPEENFWTSRCKGRLTEADTPTIRLGATPSGLTSAHLHHLPFFTGRMPFLPPNQQCQTTEGN